MASFREWLQIQEASTDYLRNPGTRQLMFNPFQRAAYDTTPYHIQAIDRGGGAIADLFQKSMYKTTDAPQQYAGYGGSYEGLDDAGLTITVPIPAENVGSDPVKAKYLGLKQAVEILENTGRTQDYDVQQAMVSKAAFMRKTTKGEVYEVKVLFPFAGHTLERQRTKSLPEIFWIKEKTCQTFSPEWVGRRGSQFRIDLLRITVDRVAMAVD